MTRSKTSSIFKTEPVQRFEQQKGTRYGWLPQTRLSDFVQYPDNAGDTPETSCPSTEKDVSHRLRFDLALKPPLKTHPLLPSLLSILSGCFLLTFFSENSAGTKVQAEFSHSQKSVTVLLQDNLHDCFLPL